MPETTVAAIITATDSRGTKILLARRGHEPFKDRWCLPGGHIDRYEPARRAIIREVKEEVGLDFGARFFGYFDEIIRQRTIHAVVMVFEGAGTGQLQAQKGEVTDIGWFSIAEACSLPLAFAHNEILEAYAARTRIVEPIPSDK